MDRWLTSLLFLALSWGAVVGLALLGVTRAFGAHPFWDVQVAIHGGGVALGLWLLARWSPGAGLGLATVVALGAAVSAAQGKAIFAASFSENALAGRVWFLGWIVLCGAVAALLSLAVEVAIRRRAGR